MSRKSCDKVTLRFDFLDGWFYSEACITHREVCGEVARASIESLLNQGLPSPQLQNKFFSIIFLFARQHGSTRKKSDSFYSWSKSTYKD